MVKLSSFAIALLLFFCLALSALAVPVATSDFTPLVFGHRGASGEAPENTLASFSLVIQEKASGLEMDLHLSKDGYIVIIHDDTLQRTTNGTGKVSDYTLAQLKQLDAGSWKGKQFAGTKIPTLQEVIDLVHKNCGASNDGCPRMIFDLKDSSDELLAALEKAVPEASLGKRIILGAWTFDFSKSCSSKISSATQMIITSLVPSRDSLAQWKAIGLNVFSIDYRSLSLDTSFVKAAHDLGMEVHVWTVDNAKDIAMVKSWGVDGIITDFPLRAEASVDASSSPPASSIADQRSQLFNSSSPSAIDWALRVCHDAGLSHAQHGHEHLVDEEFRRWMVDLDACRRAVASRCGTPSVNVANKDNLFHVAGGDFFDKTCVPLSREILAAVRIH